MMMRIAASAAALAFLHGGAMGSILMSDNFNSYTNGNLVPQGGWAAHSGAGATAIQVNNGTISTVQGSGSREDANRDIGSVMGAGNVWYAGFDVTVTGADPAVTTYFAHFRDTGTGFNSRIFVMDGGAGAGTFTFGIGDVAGTPDASFAGSYAYGTTYRVVSSYNFDTGLSQLWISPTTQADPSIMSVSADIGQAMSTYAFRQAAGNTTQVIDNLAVGTTFADVVPTPGSLSLLGLGGLVALRRRR